MGICDSRHTRHTKPDSEVARWTVFPSGAEAGRRVAAAAGPIARAAGEGTVPGYVFPVPDEVRFDRRRPLAALVPRLDSVKRAARADMRRRVLENEPTFERLFRV